MVTVTDIAARTGLDEAAVARALEALDPVYVDFRKTTTGGDPTSWYVLKATPAARQATGQWPTAQSLVSRLAEELAVAGQQEQDAERKGLLVYAARLVGDTLRDVSIRAAEAVLAPAVGLSAPAVGLSAPGVSLPGPGVSAAPPPASSPPPAEQDIGVSDLPAGSPPTR
jgi:hypothetical protein